MPDTLQKLKEITALAKHLNRLDVLDVPFVSGHTLELYVAASKAQQVAGLANLPSIDTDGMIFYHQQPTYVPYTMSEMRFDLDVAWFDASGRMVDVAHVAAGVERVYSSRPFTYVVETPTGLLPFSDLRLGI